MSDTLKRPKILLVDDRYENIVALQKVLTTVAAETIAADSGLQALELVIEHDFALAIVDVQMPEMDGYELVELLRGNYKTKRLPVIFMSAIYSDISYRLKGYSSGAVDFLSKPFIPEILLSKVTVFLELYNQRQELETLVEVVNQDKKLLEQQIWERLQMEVALNEANQALVKLNADKDKFFSIVAHDLKGPFLPLLGNAELMVEMADTLPPAEIKSMSEAIHRAGTRVYNLLEGLLQWSRLQMGRMDYQPQQCNLYNIAQVTIDLLADTAHSKQITLGQTIAADFTAYADPNMVETVIRNLTNNALKFTPANGSVTVTAHLQNEHLVEVVVMDTGVGMSPEHVKKLFRTDTHVTTTGTAHESGTGLGLLICQEMVEMNNGKIWVESELGQGTQVKFTLPRTAEDVLQIEPLPFDDEVDSDVLLDYNLQNADRTGVSKIVYLSDQINRSARRVYNLLDGMLRWAKRNLQTVDYASRRLPVTQLVKVTINRASDYAQQVGVGLQTDVSGDDLSVAGDQEQLEAILYGLLLSSIKTTLFGGQVNLTAHLLTAEAESAYVVFAISNVEKSQQHRPRMPRFTHYIYQKLLDESPQNQLDLDFIIYRELIRRNGGSLSIERDSQRGKTIRFTVPAA